MHIDIWRIMTVRLPAMLKAILAAIMLAGFAAACSDSSGIALNYSGHDPLGGMRTQFVKDV